MFLQDRANAGNGAGEELVDDTTGNEPGNGQAAGDPDGELQRRLQSMEGNQQLLTAMNSMLTDPDYIALQNAKQGGRKVKIIPLSQDGLTPEGQFGQPEQQTQAPKIDEMDDAQKTQYIIQQVVQQLQGTVQQAIQPLQQGLQQVESFRQRAEMDQARISVEQVKAKYPDFLNYKTEMLALSNQHPSLGAEELYVLAKTRAPKPLPQQMQQRQSTVITTERPNTGPSTRPGLNNKQRQPMSAGVVGLRQAIRGAARQTASGLGDQTDFGDDFGE